MTSYEFVTTFSPSGYRCYGKQFLESFQRFSRFPMRVYHESQPEATDADPLVTWRNLDLDEDRTRFLADNWNDPKAKGGNDYRTQALRFCHKVFAVSDAVKKRDAEWVIWLDADVVVTNEITEERLAEVCPENADLSFLARIDAGHTECGFVGYRADARPVQRMVEDMRRFYTTGEIFERPPEDRHDSRIFDICRLRSQVRYDRQHNISAFVRGTHVWPHTALAKWSIHNKGPKRKLATYGKIVP